MRYLLILITTVLFSAGVSAQTAKLVASSKNVVAVGEQFRLTYTLNAKGSGLKPPSLSDFDILAGPHTSQSSSIQFINGQMSQSVTNTYTYILRGKSEGKFTVGPAEITVDGAVIESNSLTIEVVKGASATTQNNGNTNSGDNGATQTNIEDISGEDLFVRVNVSDKKVYQGEHIYVEIKVYTKLNLAGFEDMKFPAFNGFWSQEIETPSQVNLVRENVNGQIYEVGTLKKLLLFPQRSGELEIEPFELDCVVRQQVRRKSRSIFDNFFGGWQNVQKKVISPKITIQVKDLPGKKPEGFNGAVGDFQLESSIDNREVNTNDAITYKIKISGNGNLKLIDAPKIEFPADFEVYDPKESNNISVSAAGARGSKTIEYLLIPRYAGEFVIPALPLSYFDPKTKSYKTLTTEEYKIKVNKGDGEENTTVVSNLSKEDIRFIGSDIRFLKTEPATFVLKGNHFFGSWPFILLYVASLALFGVVVVLRREAIKRNSNAALVRNRKASKVSKKRLKQAGVYLKEGNKEKFYDEIQKALWGYLSDKLIIPIADLSKDSAREALTRQGAEEELISKFITTMDSCEFARYAPEGLTSGMDSLYADAAQLIDKFEQKLK